MVMYFFDSIISITNDRVIQKSLKCLFRWDCLLDFIHKEKDIFLFNYLVNSLDSY